MIYKSHPWQPWSIRQIVPMVINDQLIKMLHFSKEIKNMLNAETNYISEWFIKKTREILKMELINKQTKNISEILQCMSDKSQDVEIIAM